MVLPLQAIFGDPTQYRLVDRDLSRLTAVVEIDLLLEQFLQNGCLALGAFGPAFWIAAFARFELMGSRWFSVSDVVVVRGGPRALFWSEFFVSWVWSFRPPTFRRGAGGGHFVEGLARRL